MAINTSIALGVQNPQLKTLDPMTIYQAMQDQRVNALREQMLQQTMSQNALTMQNTMEDRRIAAASRAEAARAAAETRANTAYLTNAIRGGYNPAKEAVMGPGTVQGSTPASFNEDRVLNALYAKGNPALLTAYSNMQEQFGKQREAEAKATGQGLTNVKTQAETKGLDLKNLTDEFNSTKTLISSAGSPEAVLSVFDAKAPLITAMGGSPEKSKQDFMAMLSNPSYGATPQERFQNAVLHVSQGIAGMQKHVSDMATAEAARAPKPVEYETVQTDQGPVRIAKTSAGEATPLTVGGERVQAPTKGGLTEAQRLREKRATGEDYNMAVTALDSMKDIVERATRLENADISGATGYQSLLPSGEYTSKVESDMATLKGRMTALSKIISSASGKLGNLAVQEYQMLRDQIEAFDPYKGKGATKQQLADIKIAMGRLQNRVRDVYSRTYGGEDNPFEQFRTLPGDETGGATDNKPVFDAADAVLGGG